MFFSTISFLCISLGWIAEVGCEAGISDSKADKQFSRDLLEDQYHITKTLATEDFIRWIKITISHLYVHIMLMVSMKESFWQPFQGVWPMLWIRTWCSDFAETFRIAWIFITSIACCIMFGIPHRYTLEIKMVNQKVVIPSVSTNISSNFQIYAGQED